MFSLMSFCTAVTADFRGVGLGELAIHLKML